MQPPNKICDSHLISDSYTTFANRFEEEVSRRPLLRGVILVLGIFFLGLRKWSFFSSPHLFAEDGMVFLTGALASGPSSIFLPYAGYLHLVPRIGALLASMAPSPLIPVAFLVFAIVVIGTTYGLILDPHTRLRHRMLVFLGAVLVPNRGEIFFHLTNTIWFCCFALFLLLIRDEPRTLRGKTLYFVSLALLSLSGIYSVMLAPLYFLRALTKRKLFPILSSAIVLLGGLIQGISVLRFGVTSGGSANWSFEWVRVLAYRTIVQTFLRQQWFSPSFQAHYIAPVLLIVAVLGTFWAARRFRDPVILYATTLFCLFLVSIAARIPYAGILAGSEGDRYFALPSFMMIIVLTQLLPQVQSIASRILLGLLFLVGLSNGIIGFQMERYPERSWTTDSQCFGGPQPCVVPINPPGWGFTYDPAWPHLRPWHRHP